MIANLPEPGSVAPTQTIRDHFPALERVHEGREVAYFDGPGGTQVPRTVVQEMTEYLLQHNANTHWCFPSSEETDQRIAGSRRAVADFLNAESHQIVFGQNMTTLTFHLARALGRKFQTGDGLLVTDLDHHANIDPWLDLARERGLTTQFVAMILETGQLDWDDLRAKLALGPKLLAIGGASNALGTINDVALATRLAHDAGALVFIDAVHYAPHRLVDVRAIGCDFLACSAYKFYGPHVGILYGRSELLESLDVPKLRPAPSAAPDRLETGTQNHEGIVGTGAAIDFLASLADGPTRRLRLKATFDELHHRASALVRRLWTGLNAIDRITTFGPPPESDRTPTVSFFIDGVGSDDVCRSLARSGLFASHGDFYASTTIHRLGIPRPGLVRIGSACYSTIEEIERLLAAVEAIAARRK